MNSQRFWRCGFLSALVFGVASFCSAQNLERLAPKTLPAVEANGQLSAAREPIATVNDRVTLIANLRGIVVVDSKERVRRAGAKGLAGIRIENLKVPARAEFEARLSRYLHQPLSLASLNQMQRDVIAFYREHDRPVVTVLAPEQDITSGVLQLIVIEARAGRVSAEGNRWFRSETLESQLRLHEGDEISGSRMTADLDRLNNNPFRHVELVYRPGAAVGTTDIVLKTRDRLPLRVYASYEDTGNDLTGNDRWSVGFNWGNAFGLDHQFGYQFTTSSDFEALRAHSINYIAPLPWGHTLSFLAAYAQSDVTLFSNGVRFDLGGENSQISLRYSIPLPAIGPFTHTLGAGFDFKRSNNDLLFGGTRVFDTATDIFQFNFGYDASLRDSLGATKATGSITISPGDLSNGNSDSAFAQSRAFAKSSYIYGRIGLERVTRLPFNFSLATKALWQWSNGNLLGSEQLGVGGYSSVRGYEEYEARGDSGWLFSVEVRTPPVSLFALLHHPKPVNADPKDGPATPDHSWATVNDQLQLLAFSDYGIARLHTTLPAERREVDLASIGLGLRYNISPWLSLRFDYGWQLTDSGLNDRFNSRGHVGVTVSY